jgi:intradiol ring-cleaving dioxygenase-like protein
LQRTPGQILGPFYPVKPFDRNADLTKVPGRPGRAEGQILNVMGRVLNLKGEPVRNSKIEVWQANAHGRYTHPGDTNPAPLTQILKDRLLRGWQSRAVATARNMIALLHTGLPVTSALSPSTDCDLNVRRSNLGETGGHCRSRFLPNLSIEHLSGRVVEITETVHLKAIGDDREQQVPGQMAGGLSSENTLPACDWTISVCARRAPLASALAQSPAIYPTPLNVFLRGPIRLSALLPRLRCQ